LNYLLTAHVGEAQPFISHFGLTRTRLGALSLWTGRDLRLLVTGEGKIHVRSAMEKLLADVEKPRDHHWLNFGLAGSTVYEKGRIVRINRVVTTGGRPEIPLFMAANPVADVSECLTVDGPTRDYPPDGAVDQEAYYHGEILREAGALDRLAVLKLIGDGPADQIDRSGIPALRRLLAARHSEIIRLSAMISGATPTTGS